MIEKEEVSTSLQILKILLEDLEKKHGISPQDAIRKAKGDELLLPASIFVQELTVLEAVIKYLKEGQNYSLTKIAEFLKRKPRSIWGSYKSASKKHPAQLPLDSNSILIPAKNFSHEILSPSEILVIYLKDNSSMRLSEIAKLLHKDSRTVWAQYSTGKKKMHREERK